jgi:hypothetical protein
MSKHRQRASVIGLSTHNNPRGTVTRSDPRRLSVVLGYPTVGGATTVSGVPGAGMNVALVGADSHPADSNTATSPAATAAAFRVFLLFGFIGVPFVGGCIACNLQLPPRTDAIGISRTARWFVDYWGVVFYARFCLIFVFVKHVAGRCIRHSGEMILVSILIPTHLGSSRPASGARLVGSGSELLKLKLTCN